jgi:hypothetical protein
MKLRYHLLIGFTISYILIQFFNFSILSGAIIFLSSWAIDIDHYLWYAVETKKWNPMSAIKWFTNSTPKWKKLSTKQKKEFKKGIFIFHSIGFWILLALLSYIHPAFLWILIGVAIHIAADFIDFMQRKENILDKICPIYVIRKNKNKKALSKL